MKNITLFDTSFAKARAIPGMLQQAVTFLIKNGPEVIVPEDTVRELGNIRLYSSTPISKLFQDITNAGKLNNFTFVNLNRFGKDIPQILALDDIVIDGRTVPNLPVPAQLQKCWINISPITSIKDSYNGTLNITDVATFASLVVRAALCTSYVDNDVWMNPRLEAIIVESYSATIAHVLRQAFNLAFEEEKFVQTLFAAYFCQMLSGGQSNLAMPPLLGRCQFLGSMSDIVARMEDIKPYRENGGNDMLYPVTICKILNAVGPARMNKFQPAQLYRYLSSSSIDSQTMMIAIDFPPYWVYQMLRIASGYKNPVMSNVIKLNGMLKTKVTSFATELQSTNQLLMKLDRA